MSKFKCMVCGFIYNESIGLLEKNIAPGTKWKDLSNDFLCPLCGAEKSLFEEIEENKITTSSNSNFDEEEHIENLRELSPGELSAVCSNLAKGCEKQKLPEEMDLFNQLADYFKNKVNLKNEANFDTLNRLLDFDLKEGYPKANLVSEKEADRGALRALVWNEKVSRIIKSLLSRYSKDGISILENTKIYVCDICGFVYLGDEAPKLCPVCKVPSFKISEIERS